jgi:hypothetical protein
MLDDEDDTDVDERDLDAHTVSEEDLETTDGDGGVEAVEKEKENDTYNIVVTTSMVSAKHCPPLVGCRVSALPGGAMQGRVANFLFEKRAEKSLHVTEQPVR